MSPPEPRRAPRLMLVTDRRRSVLPLPTLVDAAIAGGCDAIQVREPGASRGDLRQLASAMAEIARGRCVVVVNADVQLAKSLGLGLHLPERGADLARARQAMGPAALIGRSVHGPAAALDASGADYLLAGNVFATASHPGRGGLGLGGFGAVVAAATSPVLAIGGLDAETAAGVIAAGASGVAVVGAISSAPSPAEAQRRAAELRRIVDRALAEKGGAGPW